MTSSLFNNGFKFALSPDALSTTTGNVSSLQTVFLPNLLELNAADMRGLYKPGMGDAEFISLAYNYGRANPHMKPGFLDLDAFQQDLEAADILRTIVQGLAQPYSMACNTLLFLNARNYAAARALYKGFRAAAAMNLPGAALIVEVLARQFAGRGRTAPTPTPPADARHAAQE